MKKRRFIHYSYVFFPLMIVITLILTFSAKNNFTADFNNQIGVIGSETRSKADVETFAREQIIEPFQKLRVQDLDTKASSCFEHKLIFNYHYPEEEALPFYKDQMVSAKVVEVDCEREYYLYTLKIYFDEKKILVQTTTFDEWVSPEEYIKEYKQRINKK
ncbi:MAG: hypothetical protein ACI837_002992 [Crocinitomicaceae bacterium]|jgi:hypothetical protein